MNLVQSQFGLSSFFESLLSYLSSHPRLRSRGYAKYDLMVVVEYTTQNSRCGININTFHARPSYPVVIQVSSQARVTDSPGTLKIAVTGTVSGLL